MRNQNASTKQPIFAGSSYILLVGGSFSVLLGCSAPQGSIGALLLLDPTHGALLVREVPPEMTAAQAGLQEGDEIVAINGEDVRGATREEIHRRLKGPVGTRVELTVVRDTIVKTFTILRMPYKKK